MDVLFLVFNIFLATPYLSEAQEACFRLEGLQMRCQPAVCTPQKEVDCSGDVFEAIYVPREVIRKVTQTVNEPTNECAEYEKCIETETRSCGSPRCIRYVQIQKCVTSCQKMNESCISGVVRIGERVFVEGASPDGCGNGYCEIKPLEKPESAPSGSGGFTVKDCSPVKECDPGSFKTEAKEGPC